MHGSAVYGVAGGAVGPYLRLPVLQAGYTGSDCETCGKRTVYEGEVVCGAFNVRPPAGFCRAWWLGDVGAFERVLRLEEKRAYEARARKAAAVALVPGGAD